MTRTTYTYAVLDISDAAYTEIFDKLKAAGYEHAFHEDENRIVVDMHGIAIARASVIPESKEHASKIYVTHMNACRVCSASESPLCDEGKRLHRQLRGMSI